MSWKRSLADLTMAVAKGKQESVRETTAKKEETFIKSFRNETVIEIEEFKERQAVHPSQDRHGTMEPGPLKTQPLALAEENKQYMIRKASEDACVDDNDVKYKHDSYSEHDMRAEELRRRGSHFQDLLIRYPESFITLKTLFEEKSLVRVMRLYSQRRRYAFSKMDINLFTEV